MRPKKETRPEQPLTVEFVQELLQFCRTHGLVLTVNAGRISIYFPACYQHLAYTVESARRLMQTGPHPALLTAPAEPTIPTPPTTRTPSAPQPVYVAPDGPPETTYPKRPMSQPARRAAYLREVGRSEPLR